MQPSSAYKWPARLLRRHKMACAIVAGERLQYAVGAGWNCLNRRQELQTKIEISAYGIESAPLAATRA